jgi:hypothetical protein
LDTTERKATAPHKGKSILATIARLLNELQNWNYALQNLTCKESRYSPHIFYVRPVELLNGLLFFMIRPVGLLNGLLIFMIRPVELLNGLLIFMIRPV